MPKEKILNINNGSQYTIQKTKDWETQIPLQTGGGIRWKSAPVVTSIMLMLQTQTYKINTSYRMCILHVSEYEPNKWTGNTPNSNYIKIL
jgi:hypothetical protein